MFLKKIVIKKKSVQKIKSEKEKVKKNQQKLTPSKK